MNGDSCLILGSVTRNKQGSDDIMERWIIGSEEKKTWRNGDSEF
jgi:hypothetical protein